ncbi:MAG: ABC transporter ATP-binding protein [Chloroflexia bacterium]|nr:ABC transporter ATP-binding protein [Chloroflexia bacterium]
MKEVNVTNTSAVVLQQVTKRFQNVTAVDAIDLDIRDGEFFSMLGPSGCGKTTTLRMIAGFEFPSAGVISLDGVFVEKIPAHLRNVNTVFQSYALFPHMTVAENIAFGLEMKNVPRADIKPRVDAALAMVQLANYGARRPKQLSGGQQQRVALARALVNRPKVLLLDEPLGALDLKLRKEMQVELKRLQQEVGITFIYVTHDQEEALTMSDRIAVMHQGKLLQVGSPTEIYERPSSRFVADFIGEANFIDGHVTEIGAPYCTVRASNGLVLKGMLQGTTTVGAAVTIAVRPEKLRLTVHAPDNVSPLAANVEQVVYIGSDTRLTVRLSDTITLDVWEQNNRSTLDRDAYWQRGEQGFVTWNPDNALILTA